MRGGTPDRRRASPGTEAAAGSAIRSREASERQHRVPGPHADLDVAPTEGLASALCIEDGDGVAAHRDARQRLTSAALPVEAPAELITTTRKNA
jgi:hypothetical protein